MCRRTGSFVFVQGFFNTENVQENGGPFVTSLLNHVKNDAVTGALHRCIGKGGGDEKISN